MMEMEKLGVSESSPKQWRETVVMVRVSSHSSSSQSFPSISEKELTETSKFQGEFGASKPFLRKCDAYLGQIFIKVKQNSKHRL